ncbi:MAG: hypothetical protein AAGA17_17685 [Actinomycetota bacterium]
MSQEAVVTDPPTEVRTTGVAVNGVRFEPATAETVTGASGQTDRIEALPDIDDLGLVVNDAEARRRRPPHPRHGRHRELRPGRHRGVG